MPRFDEFAANPVTFLQVTSATNEWDSHARPAWPSLLESSHVSRLAISLTALRHMVRCRWRHSDHETAHPSQVELKLVPVAQPSPGADKPLSRSKTATPTPELEWSAPAKDGSQCLQQTSSPNTVRGRSRVLGLIVVDEVEVGWGSLCTRRP